MTVSLVVVFDLALAQPLLDLVGRHVPFLVAHNASKLQIWLMVFGLTLFVPLGLAAIALAFRAWRHAAGTIVHAGMLVFLVGILLLRFFKDLPLLGSLDGVLLLLLTQALGGTAAYLFYKRELVRSFFRVGALLPLVVIALFVFASPASKLLFLKTSEAVEGDTAAGDVPVVMLVFDEFPVASMMSREGGIDARSFPSFDRLRSESTWFRNATTVHDLTTQVVPAILDGRYPKRGTLPIVSDHPDNLFTLLGTTHRIAALEPVTALCPPGYCGEQQAEAGAFAADLWVLANHLVWPEDLKWWLPPLGDTWAGFAEPGEAGDAGIPDPREVVREAGRGSRDAEFLDMIASGDPGTFYFRHLLLPHVPWQHLPSGRFYEQDNEILGKVAEGWAKDDWLVTQGYQRHLLQSQYADRVLGEVIEQLESSGLYERALVVVLADHGITIASGRRPRDGAPNSVGSVGSVPLFVKRPFQQRPEVVDAPVETIDVVPTIVDLLDIQTGIDFDGRSLFGELDPRRTRRMPIEGFEIDPAPEQMMRVVKDKYEMFGPALHDLYSIAPEGFDDLVGRRVDELTVSSAAPYSAGLVNEKAYDDVDLASPVCPCMVDGRLAPRPDQPVVLAISVNDVVAAITRTPAVDHPEVARDRFYGMVAPERFRAGRNDVDLYVIEGGPDPTLHPIGRS